MERTSNWTPTLTPPASPTARIPWSRPSSHCCLQKAVWVPCSTLTCVILVLLEETVLCPDCCSPPRPWPVDSQPLARPKALLAVAASQVSLFQLILEKVPNGPPGPVGEAKVWVSRNTRACSKLSLVTNPLWEACGYAS